MKIKCKHCNYEWDTESDMYMVTCPSCQRKIPTKKLPKNQTKEQIKKEVIKQ